MGGKRRDEEDAVGGRERNQRRTESGVRRGREERGQGNAKGWERGPRVGGVGESGASDPNDHVLFPIGRVGLGEIFYNVVVFCFLCHECIKQCTCSRIVSRINLICRCTRKSISSAQIYKT